MLLHELDEDKNPARYYVLGNEYIGLDHNYYLTDEQGSVRYVLDAAGNIQNDYRYDAFGQRIAGHENIPNRLRYNAQIEDDLTGLYYLRARYYNTGIGRFTQEDVIYNDGLNLYAYCSSNPVMYSDPSGFEATPTQQSMCKRKNGGEKDSKSGSKTVPNPNGKKGGVAHQSVIDDIKTDAEKRGLTYDTEYKYDTTGGYKNSRYADVVVYDSKGRVMEIHQVGRTTKRTGAPVSRERKAIRDIRSSVEYNGAKIIYHPYDR